MSTPTTLAQHCTGGSSKYNKARKWKAFQSGKEEVKQSIYRWKDCQCRKSERLYIKPTGTNKWV